MHHSFPFHAKKYLKVGGILVANNSHGDASMAHLDPDFEFIAVANRRGEQFSIIDKGLERYFIPKREVDITAEYLKEIGRGVAYTKGIGRAIADLLADEGSDVAICARNEGEVTSAVEALTARGVKATGRALDVGDGLALTSWLADAAQELGGLDILVANVSALAIEGTEESWRKGFEIDMMHTVRAVNAAMPYLE